VRNERDFSASTRVKRMPWRDREPLSEKRAIRFTKSDSQLLDQIAKAWRCSPSDVVRKALAELFAKHNYLPPEQRKVLGVN